ncbi:hypothetical protein, partial [Klebsiella sp. MS 92-3]
MCEYNQFGQALGGAPARLAPPPPPAPPR